jgi:hypothetical protein
MLSRKEPSRLTPCAKTHTAQIPFSSRRVRQATSARRNRDGFWVDVEEGKHKSAMAPHSVVHHQMRPTAAYGTLVVPEKKEGMPAWLRTFFYLGAVAFCLMLVWVVYLKYYYGKV